jgi:hypothetical protein
MCLESVRTLQGVLPSPGRVFNVVSRILCSSSGGQNLRPAFPFGGSSRKVGAFCLCAKGQRLEPLARKSNTSERHPRLTKEKINIIFCIAKPAWSSPNLNEMQEQSSRLGTTGTAPQGSLTLPSARSDCFLPATIDIVTEVKARYDESCSRLILTSVTM